MEGSRGTLIEQGTLFAVPAMLTERINDPLQFCRVFWIVLEGSGETEERRQAWHADDIGSSLDIGNAVPNDPLQHGRTGQAHPISQAVHTGSQLRGEFRSNRNLVAARAHALIVHQGGPVGQIKSRPAGQNRRLRACVARSFRG